MKFEERAIGNIDARHTTESMIDSEEIFGMGYEVWTVAYFLRNCRGLQRLGDREAPMVILGRGELEIGIAVEGVFQSGKSGEVMVLLDLGLVGAKKKEYVQELARGLLPRTEEGKEARREERIEKQMENVEEMELKSLFHDAEWTDPYVALAMTALGQMVYEAGGGVHVGRCEGKKRPVKESGIWVNGIGLGPRTHKGSTHNHEAREDSRNDPNPRSLHCEGDGEGLRIRKCLYVWRAWLPKWFLRKVSRHKAYSKKRHEKVGKESRSRRVRIEFWKVDLDDRSRVIQTLHFFLANAHL